MAAYPDKAVKVAFTRPVVTNKQLQWSLVDLTCRRLPSSRLLTKGAVMLVLRRVEGTHGQSYRAKPHVY